MRLLYCLSLVLLSGLPLLAQRVREIPAAEARAKVWKAKELPGKISYRFTPNDEHAGESLWDALRLLPMFTLDAEGLRWQGQFQPSLAIDGRLLHLSSEDLASYLQAFPIDEVKEIEVVHNVMGQYYTPAEYVVNVLRELSPNRGFSGFNHLSGRLQGFVSEGLNGRLSYGNTWADADLSYGASQQRAARELRLNRYKEEEWISPRNGAWGQASLELHPFSGHSLGLMGRYARSQEDLKYSRGAIGAYERDEWMAQGHYSYANRRLAFRLTGEGLHQGAIRHHRLSPEEYLPSRETQITQAAAAAELSYRFSLDWQMKAGMLANYNKYQSVEVLPFRGVLRPEWNYSEFNLQPQLHMTYQGRQATLLLGTKVAFDAPQVQYATGLRKKEEQKIYLLPYAQLIYNPYAAHRLTVEWSSTLQRPDFRAMNVGISPNGALFTMQGNHYLQSSLTHKLGFRYSHRYGAFLEWQSAYIDSPFVQEITAKRFLPFQLQMQNWNYSFYTRVAGYLPLTFIKKRSWSWRSDLHAAWHWQEDVVERSELNLSRRRPAYFAELKQVLSLPRRWSADFGATYHSARHWGEWEADWRWWISASLAKRWDNWRLAFSVHDPLNTSRLKLIKGGNAPLQVHIEEFTPRLSLGLTWHWGTSKKTLRHLLGTEYQRLQGSGSESLRPF